MGMKGIGTKLTLSIALLVSVISVAFGISSFVTSSAAVEEQIENRVEAKAEDVSHYIEEVFNRLFVEVESIADQAVLEQLDFEQLEEPLAYLNQEIANREDYLAFGIIDANGIAYYTDGTTTNLADRDYVQAAFKGETALSDTIISRVTNEPVNMIATPIETASGEKALLLARMDGYVLSGIMDGIQIGETGYALIVNEAGTVQGHANREYVKNQMNLIDYAAETGKMTGEADAVKEIISGKNGFLTFKNTNQQESFAGYFRLDNGWTMAIVVERSEMIEGLNTLKSNLVIATIIFLVLGVTFAIMVSRSISRPITRLVRVSEQLSTGDFTEGVPDRYQKRQDELGVLARALSKMVNSMKGMITKVDMSANDVSKASCELMSEVVKVTEGTDQISNAMQEVESGAVMQAKMANEGATAMEQMAIGIQQVAEVAGSVAEHTQQIDGQIHNGHQAVHESIEQMTFIQQSTAFELEVIRKLEEESREIGLISKMIADISDQTNLLALNASIEAARAGEAGLGFAVVAGEVRKLSEQTAHSVAQINQLIIKVQDYTGQVVTAAESGEENVQKGLKTIHSVEVRFAEIVQSVEKISREIEQLSGAAQQMSANTEEVTASIEEMSATANASMDHVHEVNHTVKGQRETVSVMNKQAAEMSEMASQLRVAVSQFKL